MLRQLCCVVLCLLCYVVVLCLLCCCFVFVVLWCCVVYVVLLFGVVCCVASRRVASCCVMLCVLCVSCCVCRVVCAMYVVLCVLCMSCCVCYVCRVVCAMCVVCVVLCRVCRVVCAMYVVLFLQCITCFSTCDHLAVSLPPYLICSFSSHNPHCIFFSQLCVGTLSAILKAQKRRHKLQEIDPYQVSGVTRPSDPNTVHPGDRPDNMWMHYDPSDQPYASKDTWDSQVLVEKTHWGYYCWPTSVSLSFYNFTFTIKFET